MHALSFLLNPDLAPQQITVLSKFLPDQVKAQEFLAKFSQAMLRDQTLLQGMEVVMKPDITCKECAETTSLILKKLGQPIMTNLYYNTVKMLLERTSSVMVDIESVNVSNCSVRTSNFTIFIIVPLLI